MSLKLNQARCVESRRPGRSSRGWGWEVGGARPPEAWAGARGGWGGGSRASALGSIAGLSEEHSQLCLVIIQVPRGCRMDCGEERVAEGGVSGGSVTITQGGLLLGAGH